MADKDVDGVVAALGRSVVLADARIVATAIEAPRAMAADALAATWQRAAGRTDVGRGRSIEAESDLVAALDRILVGPPGPLVVAGSLYLVGAVRARLVDDPALRDPAHQLTPPSTPSTPPATDPGDNRRR